MSLDIPTQESARNTLDRVLQVAVSHRLPNAYRMELGLAVEWLQNLVDSGVLLHPDSGFVGPANEQASR